MRAFLPALLAAALAAVGCTDNGVGRKCINPSDAGIQGTAVASPALECPTRLCLLQGEIGGAITRSTCTAECQTDEDCQNAVSGSAKEQLCNGGFVCAVSAVAGSFKCKKFCVCKEDLRCGFNSDLDGGVITPSSCPNPSPTPSCQ
ncbi:MAG: hypothetical protein EXR72_03395 [Myxococcales bacterium]|nr:hypothetical protein [Myxococcales bacterium]